MNQKSYGNGWQKFAERGLLLLASMVLMGSLSAIQTPLNAKQGAAGAKAATGKNRATFKGTAWVAKWSGATTTSTPIWVGQYGGSSGLPYVRGLATDAKNNVFIAGEDFGSFAGSNKGGKDAWVAKLDRAGRLLWKRQLASDQDDEALGVATDSKGNVLIAGSTDGNLAGSNQGQDDVFVAKYSPVGKLIWRKQLGSGSDDIAYGIATDVSGNAYITGLGLPNAISNVFVAKLRPTGTVLWVSNVIGGPSTPSGIAVDANGNALVSGRTAGSLDGPQKGREDAWVAKLNARGNLTWIRQLGTPEFETARGVATDAKGNVFVAGDTEGNLAGGNRGADDAWIAQYSPLGVRRWVKQLGTTTDDRAYGVATDSKGNAVIAGWTSGSLGGRNKGLVDVWSSKFSPLGALRWSKQIGSTNNDLTYGATIDTNDDVLVGGGTAGIIE